MHGLQPNQTGPYPSDRARFRALSSRDARADAHFVYAVVTTGVYCRPSCGARLPRPEHVRYFEASAQAEQAGYRACKRCRPGAASQADREQQLVARARRLLEQAETRLPLAELALQLGTSKFHLHRLFKRHTGFTPRQYAAAHRLSKARRQLVRGQEVTRAIHEAGYSSPSRFYADSGALGMPASKLRARGAGQALRFAHATSKLGNVLVATTQRGVCWVALGSDRSALERELIEHFARASSVAADRRVRALARQVASWIDAGQGPELPLDLLGTSFQLRVWKALRDTPPGSTLSYGELAEKLGMPGAARAVGKACGDNTVAVLVPCHRVLRKDGSLGGYRWGLERKRALLEREAAARRR